MYYASNQHINSTLGVTANNKRTLKSGREYDVLFPRAKGIVKTIDKDADVYKTLDLIQGVVERTLDQTKAITEQLQKECGAKNGERFYKALFDFVYQHIQYITDEEGFEDLSEPALLWANRKHGGDCDCFAIFILSCLTNAGISNKYARIVRLLDEKGQPKDYFQHIYVVVPKVANADMYNKQQYWVIDPVLDEFNTEPQFVVEQFDKPMVAVRVLSGLGCPDDANVDNETKALIAERNLIASGKHPFVCTKVNRENAVAAIDYFLQYKNDPQLRVPALRILQERVGDIILASNDQSLEGLKSFFQKIGNKISDVADKVADKVKDSAKETIKVVKKVNPAFVVMRTAYRGLIALNVHGWATKWHKANQANPQAVRNFWEKWGGNYGDFMSAVNEGASKKSLLGTLGEPATIATVTAAVATATPVIVGAAGALAAIAGAADKFGILPINGTPNSTPETNAIITEANQFYSVNPVSGVFDWVGGQNNGLYTGFHISANSLNAGDKIRITVTSGNAKYNGVWPIVYMGADDGTYQDSMATVAIPRVSGEASASGTWELVSQDVQISNSPGANNEGMSTTTKVILTFLGIGTVAAIAYAVSNNDTSNNKAA